MKIQDSFLGDEKTIKEDEQSTTSYTFCSYHTLNILDISDDGILFLCVVWFYDIIFHRK